MKLFRPGLWMLSVLCLMTPFAGRATSIAWFTNRTEAVEAARNSGKLILLLAGRETCGNCSYMKYTVCETGGVRQVIDSNYVCWFCPVDDSSEWYAYASGLGSFILPLICVIDPGDATTYLDRTTSVQAALDFQSRLASHLPASAITVSLSRTASSLLTWPTENQLRYRVLKSQDMRTWSFVGGIHLGDGSAIELADASVTDRCFYRVMGFK